MKPPAVIRAGALLVLIGLLATTPGGAQVRPKAKTTKKAPTKTSTAFVPRFEAVAETRLLMEGMANANYRSVQRLLKNKPADVETWKFARGQAILIAEAGNLLLLRPPRNSGRDTWMKLAMDMRSQAAEVARKVAARDHAGSKAALGGLTNSCNRCHQAFRVDVRVAPEADMSERDT